MFTITKNTILIKGDEFVKWALINTNVDNGNLDIMGYSQIYPHYPQIFQKNTN
ncbi:hypothetical protein ACQKJC_18310 [Priestia koreensis]|uniref:hypothetical protein n=1 Tax=Priestia koreensis TaxID=284581 RepID=UPI003D00DB6D